MMYIQPNGTAQKEAIISPEHVELEFEKPYVKNCKSNSLYPEFMAEFALSLSFCTLFPIILIWNLFSIYLKTHIFLNQKFQHAATLETRRFKVPYVKPMFTVIFIVATFINFYHFYEYFYTFSSFELEQIIGKEEIVQHRFWFLLIVEHVIILFFIIVNLFGKGGLNLVRKRAQTQNEKIYLERYNK